MSEIIFLTIAASAAAFKAVAIMIGIIWAVRTLLTQHGAPLKYRYSRTELPFLSVYGSRSGSKLSFGPDINRSSGITHRS